MNMEATFTDLWFRDSIPRTHFQVEKNVEHGLEGLDVMRGWCLVLGAITHSGSGRW